MTEDTRSAHWERVYATKDEQEMSWFEEVPRESLDLISKAHPNRETRIIDVGGGASRLVDMLVERGQAHVTVLDLSAAAVEVAKSRLPTASNVEWIVADVTKWQPDRCYHLWHDRAAFHFLTSKEDQSAYAAVMHRALAENGLAVIGTFSPSGPDKCSGLPVARHDGESLQRIFGPRFRLISSETYRHTTPWSSTQDFQFSTFIKIDRSRITRLSNAGPCAGTSGSHMVSRRGPYRFGVRGNCPYRTAAAARGSAAARVPIIARNSGEE
ncbi:class I SAM-dependent methyltransferase [Rhizobium sp. BK251]|uniref:class I SAM-dependent methyltransferase n=1 Tax=Rhizobium sp. BK251 TaxID=2512125 RepID=UPI001043A95B|nr:methyltransferase family protein [Rhizobium sp. BK251]